MTDFLSQVSGSIAFFLEEFFYWPYHAKYIPTILANISTSFIVYIGLSCLMLFVTLTRKPPTQERRTNESDNFDISPEDEVVFESSVSQDQVDEEIKRNTPGQHIPFHGNEQLDDYLAGGGKSQDLVTRVKLARQSALRKKIEKEMSPEDRKTEEQ